MKTAKAAETSKTPSATTDKKLSKGARTKARIIETTVELLRTQGYYRTGLKQILSESNTPRGSFYFHFPGGKEELAGNALQAAGTAWREMVLELTAQSDLVAALAQACEFLATVLKDSGYTKGCPMATTALEAAAEVDVVHRACSEHFRLWIEAMEARLQSAGMPEERRRPVAMLVLSSIEGALVLCRAQRSTEPLEVSAKILCDILRYELSQAAMGAPSELS